MELILKAKDIRVEFKGRDVLDINELEVYWFLFLMKTKCKSLFLVFIHDCNIGNRVCRHLI